MSCLSKPEMESFGLLCKRRMRRGAGQAGNKWMAAVRTECAFVTFVSSTSNSPKIGSLHSSLDRRDDQWELIELLATARPQSLLPQRIIINGDYFSNPSASHPYRLFSQSVWVLDKFARYSIFMNPNWTMPALFSMFHWWAISDDDDAPNATAAACQWWGRMICARDQWQWALGFITEKQTVNNRGSTSLFAILHQ